MGLLDSLIMTLNQSVPPAVADPSTLVWALSGTNGSSGSLIGRQDMNITGAHLFLTFVSHTSALTSSPLIFVYDGGPGNLGAPIDLGSYGGTQQRCYYHASTQTAVATWDWSFNSAQLQNSGAGALLGVPTTWEVKQRKFASGTSDSPSTTFDATVGVGSFVYAILHCESAADASVAPADFDLITNQSDGTYGTSRMVMYGSGVQEGKDTVAMTMAASDTWGFHLVEIGPTP